MEATAHSERDLLRWATRSLPKGRDAEETLEWLLREGEGEKLESIAESANVPAPRVRKRVSRLRAHLREHWAKEAAALAALGIILGLTIHFLRKKPVEPIAHDPLPVPTVSPEDMQLRDRAKEMRRVAFVACDNAEWVTCLNGLNAARELDPEGDKAANVGAARARAEEEIQKQITPAPSTTQKVAPPLNQKSSTPPAPVCWAGQAHRQGGEAVERSRSRRARQQEQRRPEESLGSAHRPLTSRDAVLLGEEEQRSGATQLPQKPTDSN